MKVKKKFSITFSAKLPRGAIISYGFGTELEEDNADPDELHTMVEKLTTKDIKNCLAKDNIFKEAMEKVKEDVKHNKKMRKSEEEFENL